MKGWPFDPVKAAVAVVLIVAGWQYVEAREARAKADAFQAEARIAKDSADASASRLERELDRRAAELDSIRAAHADSIARLEAERAAERDEAIEEARRAEQTGDSLAAAVVDAVSGPELPVVERLMAQHLAEDERERRLWDDQRRSFLTQISDERRLHAAQVEAVEARGDSLARRAEEALMRMREQIRLLNAENDALRDAMGTGFWTRMKWTGIGAFVGAAGWEVVR